MEKLLTRLARQLDALDEASLMSLWSKYATIASRFEPTQRWEEAVLVFSMIQAKRYKNQLFNYYWAQQAQPHEDGPAPAAQPLAPGPRRGIRPPPARTTEPGSFPGPCPAHKKLTLLPVQHGPGRLPHPPGPDPPGGNHRAALAFFRLS